MFCHHNSLNLRTHQKMGVADAALTFEMFSPDDIPLIRRGTLRFGYFDTQKIL